MIKLVTINDVADSFGISARTVWNLMRSHKLRPIKIGRSVRFDESEIKRFIESSRTSEVAK